MDNKLFFIIGMRRSGTSITRELILKHPEVKGILFEPHELLHTVQTIHIPRYRNSVYHQETMDKFLHTSDRINSGDKWFGAKIAVNAGIEAMNWKWIDHKFSDVHYIFPIRNAKDTYDSWVSVDHDQPRGIVPFEMYEPWHKHINDSFRKYVIANPHKASVIPYNYLLEAPDRALEPAWNTLNLKPLKGLDKFIKKPKHLQGA